MLTEQNLIKISDSTQKKTEKKQNPKKPKNKVHKERVVCSLE